MRVRLDPHKYTRKYTHTYTHKYIRIILTRTSGCGTHRKFYSFHDSLKSSFFWKKFLSKMSLDIKGFQEACKLVYLVWRAHVSFDRKNLKTCPICMRLAELARGPEISPFPKEVCWKHLST